MKTLKAIFLAIFCLSGSTLFAQSTLDGKVLDEAGKPIPFVTIGLMAAQDSTLVKATASDPKGVYVLEGLPSGRYLVKTSAVGYHENFTAYFELADSRKSLPNIVMSVAVNELDEVRIAAKKPFVEQQIDRMVVNVEGSIIGSGSTALEVLQKAPGVTVDYQNDQIQLKGKAGVIVQIDGKQSYLSQQDVVALLRTMSSDNIATIELITNPGARYDAAGNAGIINIRLKKNASLGTNGALSLAGGSGIYDKERASLQLNNRTAKLNLFGSYSLNRGGNLFSLLYTSIQPDPTESDPGRQTYGTSTSYLPMRDLGQNAKAGIDFSPTKNTIIGVVWTGLWSRHTEDGTAQSIFSRTDGGAPYLQADTHKKINSLSKNQIANLNVQHSFGEKGQLSADIDYGQFNRDFTNDLLFTNTISQNGDNASTNALFNHQPTTVKIRTAKADYSRELAQGWKIETGLKMADITTDNDLTVRDGLSDNVQINPELSNHFIYSERVGAAYASITGGIGKVGSLKTNVQLGLRMEHTRSEGNSLTLNQVIARKYLNFFPSVFVSRPLSNGRSLSLSYSYRIDRPNYQNLNPARSYVDPFAFSQGNAFLRPQYTSAFELRYGLKNGIFLALGANLTTDFVNSIFYGFEGNKRYIIWQNVGNAQGYSITAGLPLTITKGWQVQTTAMGYFNQYQLDYESESISINNLAGRLNVNNAFLLGKGWSAELSGWVSTPSTQFLNISPWLGSVDIGVQKTLTEALKVKFSLQDVFYTNRWIARMDVPGKLVSYAKVQWDSRVALLNLTYTFGNQKVKAARQRRTGSEDESSRAN
ncbi:outer membrane beta-barrel protein [Persicitalea sp.]|uniref:outer membrane beta-barrel protein n=1 Tax=Persicitalea sp. TaxID=3100273 RepID=UPI003593D3E0